MNQLELIFPESDRRAEARVLVRAKREQRNRQEAQLSKDGSYFVIRLSKGKEAKIDPEDVDRVASHRWKAVMCMTRWYAKRNLYLNGKSRNISMSRLIMGEPEGMQVDHINGDSLDNRRSNLRLCTHRENHYAARVRKPHFSSKFRGVSWSIKDKRWISSIHYNWQRIHIGQFKSEIEAAIARDFFSYMLHGEFAQINVTDDIVECTLIPIKEFKVEV